MLFEGVKVEEEELVCIAVFPNSLELSHIETRQSEETESHVEERVVKLG